MKLLLLNDIPHAFTRFGSVNLARPGMSETRSVCTYPPCACEIDGMTVTRTARAMAATLHTQHRVLIASLPPLSGIHLISWARWPTVRRYDGGRNYSRIIDQPGSFSEECAQHAASPKQSRHDGSDGHGQDLRHLRVREAADVIEDDGFAVGSGQPQDRATSLLEERGAHLREALGHIGGVEARNRPGTRPSLDFPQECRAEDGEQPGPGCGELMKLVQRAERA